MQVSLSFSGSETGARLSGGPWQRLSFAHLQISHMGQSVRSPPVRRRAAESTHGHASGRKGDAAATLTTQIHLKRNNQLIIRASHGGTDAEPHMSVSSLRRPQCRTCPYTTKTLTHPHAHTMLEKPDQTPLKDKRDSTVIRPRASKKVS